MSDTVVEVVEDGIKAEWVNLYEGYEGDYDPDNSEDKNLLRFELSIWDDELENYTEVPDSSYCTSIPADTDLEILESFLKIIISETKNDILNHGHAKRTCEYYSHLNEADILDLKNIEDNFGPK